MNKKLIALLSSVLSGALIVGGAFATTAAWAVTDEANNLTGTLTGSTISQDETTYVTLSWGTGTTIGNVENMANDTNYKLGLVNLQTNSATYNRGTLSVSLSTDATATLKLIDYVSVKVYAGDQSLGTNSALPEGDPIDGGTLNPQYNQQSKSYAISPSVSGDKVGNKYTIFVAIKECSLSTYSQVKGDKVYVRVDWVPNSADLSSTKRVYTTKPDGWDGNFNLYAFNDSTDTDNGGWPGKALTAEAGTRNHVKYYYYDVPTTFEGFVLNNSGNQQTGNIALSGWTAVAPVVSYDFSTSTATWSALPAEDAAMAYKLVGDMNGAAHAEANWSWANGVAFTLNDSADPGVEEYYINNLALKKGDQIKAIGSNDAGAHLTWYPTEGDNYVVPNDGTYNVYFRPAGNYAWTYYYLYVGAAS